MKLFSIGVPKNTGCVISGHKSSDLIECTGPNTNSDIDYNASNIVSESKKYLSDNNNNSQNLNEQEFYENFYMAQEVLNKNRKQSFNITNNQKISNYIVIRI
ncbi:21100_t:CDS:2 [Racocetra persica]|uniref:21100_t:CDS:1 n=1 Tax=Racocetra persica TaxID=160502 RepID=A0ACA9L627_9GLOM|nr:21100_t:CDS:2 [Racocetra persica]